MDDPQGAKDDASTQYIFHVQDATGLVTRLEAIGADGVRREVTLPQPMTLHVPPSDAAGAQSAAPHPSPHHPAPQGTFLWSEVAGAHPQPNAPGHGMGPPPQFTAAQGPTHFAPGTHFAGAPPYAPPPGRTVKLQLTPPGFGHTARFQPGAGMPAGGQVSGPPMGLHPGAPGTTMGPGHAPGGTTTFHGGPGIGIVLAPYLGPVPGRPDDEGGPRTQLYG